MFFVDALLTYLCPLVHFKIHAPVGFLWFYQIKCVEGPKFDIKIAKIPFWAWASTPAPPNGVAPCNPTGGRHADPLLQMWNPHLSYPRSGPELNLNLIQISITVVSQTIHQSFSTLLYSNSSHTKTLNLTLQWQSTIITSHVHNIPVSYQLQLADGTATIINCLQFKCYTVSVTQILILW